MCGHLEVLQSCHARECTGFRRCADQTTRILRHTIRLAQVNVRLHRVDCTRRLKEG